MRGMMGKFKAQNGKRLGVHTGLSTNAQQNMVSWLEKLYIFLNIFKSVIKDTLAEWLRRKTRICATPSCIEGDLLGSPAQVRVL